MITVNNHTISESDILHEMQYHPANDHRAAMVNAAESLIIGELLQQRASRLKLTDRANNGSSTLSEKQQNDLLNQ